RTSSLAMLGLRFQDAGIARDVPVVPLPAAHAAFPARRVLVPPARRLFDVTPERPGLWRVLPLDAAHSASCSGARVARSYLTLRLYAPIRYRGRNMAAHALSPTTTPPAPTISNPKPMSGMVPGCGPNPSSSPHPWMMCRTTDGTRLICH